MGTSTPARGQLVDVPYLKQLPTREHSLARALNEGGYQTWHVGKWHLGGDGHLPEDHGFEVNIGGAHQGLARAGRVLQPLDHPPLADADVPEGTYLTDYLTDQVLELIRHKDERPFFLNLWYYTVHTPIQAKPEKIAKYEAKARALGLDQVETFAEGEYFPLRAQKRSARQTAAHPIRPSLCGHDREASTKTWVASSTYSTPSAKPKTPSCFSPRTTAASPPPKVPPTCNAPLAEGKGWMYEGGTREPLLVRWPGQVAAGSTCPVPVTSPDFYPTILELADLDPIPIQHCDGTSIAPLMRGAESIEREAIFWHYPHYGNQGGTPGSSVRSGRLQADRVF